MSSLRFKLFSSSVTIDSTVYFICIIFYLMLANCVLNSPSILINKFSISNKASFSSILDSSFIFIDLSN